MIESITGNYVAQECACFLSHIIIKVPSSLYFHICWCHPTFPCSLAWLIVQKTLSVSKLLYLDSDRNIFFFWGEAYVALYASFNFLFICYFPAEVLRFLKCSVSFWCWSIGELRQPFVTSQLLVVRTKNWSNLLTVCFQPKTQAIRRLILRHMRPLS